MSHPHRVTGLSYLWLMATFRLWTSVCLMCRISNMIGLYTNVGCQFNNYHKLIAIRRHFIRQFTSRKTQDILIFIILSEWSCGMHSLSCTCVLFQSQVGRLFAISRLYDESHFRSWIVHLLVFTSTYTDHICVHCILNVKLYDFLVVLNLNHVDIRGLWFTSFSQFSVTTCRTAV